MVHPARPIAARWPGERSVKFTCPWLAGGWARAYAIGRECVRRADSTISAPLKAISIAGARRDATCAFPAAEALVPMTHQRELRRARVMMAATQAAILASRTRRRKPCMGEPLRTSPRERPA